MIARYDIILQAIVGRHATSIKLTLLLYRYQESEGSDFGEEEDDSDAEAPRKIPTS